MLPIKTVFNRLKRTPPEKVMPFDGYEPSEGIPLVDDLSDGDLERLNELLDWNTYVVDGRGRRFGKVAWSGKRTEPQPVPDPRILKMHEVFDLSNKHVLELGCFEGIHTAGLLKFAREVTAVDARIENVVKTMVRTAFFGYSPKVLHLNVEEVPRGFSIRADLAHHVGVLYHLKDPARHLMSLAEFVQEGLMLDTHYANEEEASDSYEVNGEIFRYKRYVEGGYQDAFSGLYDHSKWLVLKDILRLLNAAGFSRILFQETRQERNGPRVLILAARET